MWKSNATISATVVGVFTSRAQVDRAIKGLRMAGFRQGQIGILAPDEMTSAAEISAEDGKARSDFDSWPGSRGLTRRRLVTGPALVAGTLETAFSAAENPAGTADLGTTLVGWGIPEGEAKRYEDAFHSGKLIVTVLAESRDAKVRSILQDAVH